MARERKKLILLAIISLVCGLCVFGDQHESANFSSETTLKTRSIANSIQSDVTIKDYSSETTLKTRSIANSIQSDVTIKEHTTVFTTQNIAKETDSNHNSQTTSPLPSSIRLSNVFSMTNINTVTMQSTALGETEVITITSFATSIPNPSPSTKILFSFENFKTKAVTQHPQFKNISMTINKVTEPAVTVEMTIRGRNVLLISALSGCLLAIVSILVFCVIICICCNRKNIRCDKQNRSKSGITDQAYFIDYNQLDDNLKVLQSPQPLLTERQQGTIELLSYEHTVNGSSEETRYVTITAQGMHEGPHKPIQSSFHKPPSDDKDSTPVTIMGSPMDTDERPPVGHASVFTQHTIPHKHSAMEVVKREHSHSGLAKSSELSRFPVNIKQIEEANKSLRTHCPEVKTVDSDRAKESSPEVESERSKKLSSRPIQEVDLETSLRQMSPLAKTVDSEKAKKLLRGSGKYRETEKPLRGPSPETETVDYAGAKESLREPSPQVKQVDSEGAKTFSRESGKDRGTIRLDKTIEKPLRGPSPEIETVHFAGAKKSLREPSLQVKTEAAKKLIRESGKDRDSEKGTEKPLRGPSPEIETADSARATRSLREPSPQVQAVNSEVRDAMTQLAGKAKSASSESGTGQKGKFNLKFSGDSDKSQRKPVKSRQVKEMVILKNPRTVSRKHTGKAELPPNSQTDPRQNNVGNDPTRLEDNSQKNQSTLSTGKSLTTAGAINAEHFRKVTPKYAKDSMQSISYSKPPALESAVVAGPNDTIPVSDEPHSRKVGQPQFRSTASETVADTADNELNQSQWLLRERLRQHFMKLKQRISSQTGTEESKSDTLVSRWNRRLKHTLEPLWEGFRKYVESASKECHEQAHTWERKQKSTKDDSYASDCLNDAKDEPKLPERGYLEDIDFVADEFDMILRAMPEVPERNYLEDIDFVSKEFELFFRRKSNQQDEDSKAKSVQGTGSSDEEGEFVHSHLTTSDDKHFHHQNAGDMSAFSASPHYQPLLFNNEEEHLHQESELPPLHVSPSVSRNVLNPSEGPYQPLIFKQDSTNEDDSPKSTSSSKMRDTSKGHYQPLIFKRDSTNEDDSPKVTSSSKMRDTLKDHYQPLIFEGHNSSSNNYEPVTFINPSQSSSAARDTDLLEESRMNMASKHSKLPVRSSSIPVAPDSGTTPKVTIDNT